MREEDRVSRRRFFKVGGALIAGSVMSAASGNPLGASAAREKAASDRIQSYRLLGRTGFKVSDISYGCGQVRERNLIRYALDKGINHFDTAEAYGNGASERAIGKALPHVDRNKVFITTKLELTEKDDKGSILKRFSKSQERLNTDYVDALFIHGVTRITDLDNRAFHAAAAELKSQGRLKHVGISCHGPDEQGGDRMEDVCIAAAESGRYDLMLVAYDFISADIGNRILAACKKSNVGTTAMKTAQLSYEQLQRPDSENQPEKWLEMAMERGYTREQAAEMISNKMENEKKDRAVIEAFLEKHGIASERRLREASVQWVLSNPDMQTVCVSMPNYSAITNAVRLSGTTLASADHTMLRGYASTFNAQFCRIGCNECVSSCPANVPVGTIMRYAYYFRKGRQKDAMAQYAALGTRAAGRCLGCHAPCESACPYRVQVQACLTQIDSELSFLA